MKKLFALLLISIMAFAVVSCDKGAQQQQPTAEQQQFEDFTHAVNQTPAAQIKVVTEFTTELGVLGSTIDTRFNPDGSATINYSIENFDSDFVGAAPVITKTGTVTLNKDGSYSDGGEFEGLIGSSVSSVLINLDSTKFESYNIDGGTLSAVVKAENTEAVFGTAIAADVNFMLTISNDRVISVVLNYKVAAGTVETVISYS